MTTATATGRHRRPGNARTRGPSHPDPRHRRDVPPDDTAAAADAGAMPPCNGAGREDAG